MNGKLQKVIFICIAVFIIVAVVMDIVVEDRKITSVTPDVTKESETEAENESVSESETESETERVTETETDSVSENDTETESETETETESETETETESETELETEAATESETKRPATEVKAQYEVVFECVNSWENNGRYNFQYNGRIYNKSNVGISSWKAEFTIPEGCVISSSWNGTCSISGNSLLITPADWNGKVEPGSDVEACGFIIEAPAEIGKLVYNGSGTGVIQKPDETATQPVTVPSEEPVTEPATEIPYVPPVTESGTPFENHGVLSVAGVNLTDCNGKAYQLKGVSTFGLQWMPQYVNKDTFKYLRDSWGVNTMRLAMYTAEGGYCSGGNKVAELEGVIDRGVKACTELGMYVIIDWHILSDGNPNTYKEQAKAFFAKMSSRYSGYDNVIYEICNEPNGTSWSEVKRYADEVIPVIRANDADAIIIVGTPTWSQDVELVASNPLKQENRHNVMYAAHFYAATHGDNIRNKIRQAISDGTPVFISEFSICDASGNGAIDYNSAEQWKALIKEYNLSYAGWNLGNKNESSALIKAGVDKLYGWSDSEISDTGKWLRNLIQGK